MTNCTRDMRHLKTPRASSHFAHTMWVTCEIALRRLARMPDTCAFRFEIGQVLRSIKSTSHPKHTDVSSQRGDGASLHLLPSPRIHPSRLLRTDLGPPTRAYRSQCHTSQKHSAPALS